eukprot:11140005-Karenia_brevis.AAC.1
MPAHPWWQGDPSCSSNLVPGCWGHDVQADWECLHEDQFHSGISACEKGPDSNTKNDQLQHSISACEE